MKVIYTTTAAASAGREGNTALTDGALSLDLAVPGSGKPGHNPEQLFAMGYAACFDSAAKISAKKLGLPLKGSKSSVTVSLVQNGETYRLDVKVDLGTEGLSEEQAKTLSDAAHNTCPYSNALRGNVTVSHSYTVN
ncbi:MAG: Ohr family peroxiredoxin [Parvularculaceae bacterium]|nr:Ohr family peroxiredoxin [Parvularculaceae bacterium]